MRGCFVSLWYLFNVRRKLMRITLFEIFGLKIRSYGLMIAIGIIIASSLLIRAAKKKGYDEFNYICCNRLSVRRKVIIYNN